MYYGCSGSFTCGINMSVRFINGDSLNFIEKFDSFFFFF